jgi:hypothetical protein
VPERRLGAGRLEFGRTDPAKDETNRTRINRKRADLDDKSFIGRSSFCESYNFRPDYARSIFIIIEEIYLGTIL